jgi:predicted DNA-binding protein
MCVVVKVEKKLNRQVTFLEDEQLARLRQISANTGAPISTLIRMAVAEFLKAKK